jgi:hypothetical protein
MSGWNWVLMALSEQGSDEMSLAGIQLASEMASAKSSEQKCNIGEIPVAIFKDDASHVLKVYYDAQPG